MTTAGEGVGYVSKVLELLMDLLSYLQTRAHVAPYLLLRHLFVLLASLRLYRGRSFVPFWQQVYMLLDLEWTVVTTSSTKDGAAGPVH